MNQRLEDALRGWRVARAKDDELSLFVAGEKMAQAITEELWQQSHREEAR